MALRVIRKLVEELDEVLKQYAGVRVPPEIHSLFGDGDASADSEAKGPSRSTITTLVEYVAALAKAGKSGGSRATPRVTPSKARVILLALMRRVEAVMPETVEAQREPFFWILDAASAAFARTLANPNDFCNAFKMLLTGVSKMGGGDFSMLLLHLGPGEESSRKVGPVVVTQLCRALRRQRCSLVDTCFDLRNGADASLSHLKLRGVNWSTYKGGYSMNIWIKPDQACMGFCAFMVGAVETVMRVEMVRTGDRFSSEWAVSLASGPSLAFSGGIGSALRAKIDADFKMGDSLWHNITISHSDPYLTKSQLQVMLDGKVILEEAIKYPDAGENSRTVKFLEGFVGQAGTLTVYEGAISSEEAELLHYLGPGSPQSNHWSGIADFSPHHLQSALQTPFAAFNAGTPSGKLSQRHIHLHFNPARTRRVSPETGLICLETVASGRVTRTTVKLETAANQPGACQNLKLTQERALRLEGQVSAVTIPGGTPSWWGMLGGGGLRATLLLLHHTCCACRALASAGVTEKGDAQFPSGDKPLSDLRIHELDSCDEPQRQRILQYGGAVAEILGILALLIKDPSYRQDCLQISGYHCVASSLLLLPCSMDLIGPETIRSLVSILNSVATPKTGAVADLHSMAAIVQAIFLNIEFLSGLQLTEVGQLLDAAVSVLLPENGSTEGPVLALATTTQELLDILKLKVCHQGHESLGVDRTQNSQQLERITCINCILRLLEHLTCNLGGFSAAFKRHYGLEKNVPAPPGHDLVTETPPSPKSSRRRKAKSLPFTRKHRLKGRHHHQNTASLASMVEVDVDGDSQAQKAQPLRSQDEPLLLIVTEALKSLLDCHSAAFASAILDFLDNLSAMLPTKEVHLALFLARFHDEVAPRLVSAKNPAFSLATRLRILKLLIKVLAFGDEIKVLKLQVLGRFVSVGEATSLNLDAGFVAGYVSGLGLANFLRSADLDGSMVETFCENDLARVDADDDGSAPPAWLVLPILAGLWNAIGYECKERITMAVNLQLKTSPGNNPMLDSCVEHAATVVAALLIIAGVPPNITLGLNGIDKEDLQDANEEWQEVRGFGEGGITLNEQSREQIVRDLALDTIAVTISHFMVVYRQGWSIWRMLLAQVYDQVEPAFTQPNAAIPASSVVSLPDRLSSLKALAASVLQRTTRSLGEIRIGNTDILAMVSKVMIVIEERLLNMPGVGLGEIAGLDPVESNLLHAVLEIMRCVREAPRSVKGRPLSGETAKSELQHGIVSVLRPALRITLKQLPRLGDVQASAAAEEVVGTLSHLTCLPEALPDVALDSLLIGFGALQRGIKANSNVDAQNVYAALTLALTHGLLDMARNPSAQSAAPNKRVAKGLIEVFEGLKDNATADEVFEALGDRIVNAEIVAAEDRDMVIPLFPSQPKPAAVDALPMLDGEDSQDDLLTGELGGTFGRDGPNEDGFAVITLGLLNPNPNTLEYERFDAVEEYSNHLEERSQATVKFERQRLRVAMAAQDAQASRVRTRFRKIRHYAEAEFGVGLPPQARGAPKLDVTMMLGPPDACCRIMRPSSRKMHPMLVKSSGGEANVVVERERSGSAFASPVMRPTLQRELSMNELSMNEDALEEVGRALARRCNGYIRDVTQAEASTAAEGEEDAWGLVEAQPQDVVGFVSNPEASEVPEAADGNPASATSETASNPSNQSGTIPKEALDVDIEDGAAEEVHQLVTDSLMDRRLHTAPGQGPDVGNRGSDIRLRIRNVSCIMPTETLLCDIVVTKKHLFVQWKPTLSKEKVEMAAGEAGFLEEGAETREMNTWEEYEGETLAASNTFNKGASRKFRKTHLRWSHRDISAVLMRRYRLRNTGVEIFYRRGKRRSLFLDLQTANTDEVFGESAQAASPATEPGGATGEGKEGPSSSSGNPGERATALRDDLSRLVMRLAPSHAIKQWPHRTGAWVLTHKLAAKRRWQEHKISTFEYLLQLNLLAGRSFNDLCQYPVFPWILKNYDSDEIDLSDPANYRDLTKPMGAQSESRLEQFIARYEAMKGDPELPPFMYGSHYSTAVGVVLHFLLRMQPFSDLHRQIQGGQFDVADRLFCSIGRSWESNTASLSEVKELTPEWFCMPDFLVNKHGFNLGRTQDGRPVGDVELPPWAKGDAGRFIRIHRAALESPYVSMHINRWIDLIFGCAQQGPEAVKRHNVYFYLTYYGAVDVAAIEDSDKRHATELQIAHFGQCPTQLYRTAHPPRATLQTSLIMNLPTALVATLPSRTFHVLMEAAYERAAFTQGLSGAPLVPLRTTVPPMLQSSGKKLLRPLSIGVVNPGDKVLMVTAGGLLDLLSWSIHSSQQGDKEEKKVEAVSSPQEKARLKDEAQAEDLTYRKMRIVRHSNGANLDRVQLGWSGDFLKPRHFSVDSPEGSAFNPDSILHEWVPPPPALISEGGFYIITAAGPGGSTLQVTQTDATEMAAAAGSQGGSAASIARTAGIEIAPPGTGITTLAFLSSLWYSDLVGSIEMLVGFSNGATAIYSLQHTNSRIERPSVTKRPRRIFRCASGGVSCLASLSDAVVFVCGRFGSLQAHSIDREEMLWTLPLRPTVSSKQFLQPRAICVSEGLGLIALHLVRAEQIVTGVKPDAPSAKEVHEIHLVTVNGEALTMPSGTSSAKMDQLVVPSRRQGVVKICTCGTGATMLCICYGNGDVEFRDLCTFALVCYFPSPTRRGEADPLSLLAGAADRRGSVRGSFPEGPGETMLAEETSIQGLCGRGAAAMESAPSSNFMCATFHLGPSAIEPLLMIWAWKDGSISVQALPCSIDWSAANQALGLGRVLQDTWKGVRAHTFALAGAGKDAAESVGGSVRRIAEEAVRASPGWISNRLKSILPGS